MSIGDQPGSAARAGRRLEATVGLLTAVFVGFIVVGAGALAMIPHGHGDDPHFGWTMAAICAAIIGEGTFVCLASDDLRHGRFDPFAPAFALRLGRVPLLLRPILVAWWLAHFALGVVAAFAIEFALAGGARSGDELGPAGWAIQLAAFVGIGFTLAFAFNLYAMLALAAAGFGERVISVAWRWRVAIDLAVAIAAAMVASRHG